MSGTMTAERVRMHMHVHGQASVCKASNECFLSFFWVGGEVEDNFASFPCAPQNFPGWVLYRGLFDVGLIAVFAEEGLKKGVGLINGGFGVGLQSRGGEYVANVKCQKRPNHAPCLTHHP